MRIKRYDTITNKEKEVVFGEVVKSFEGKLKNIEITYKLLGNKTLKNGRYEYQKKVN